MLWIAVLSGSIGFKDKPREHLIFDEPIRIGEKKPRNMSTALLEVQ